MKVWERSELQTRLIRNMRARSSEITYYGPGPVRSFLYAVATELQHLYYRLFRADLKQDALRALGSDLDEIAATRGLTRLGAAQSSAVLLFSGTAGTVIPVGFQVQSATGVVYLTTESGTLTLTDSTGTTATKKLVAQSVTAGSGSTASRGSLTNIVTPLSGLLSVTNLAPSVGGRDQESDEELRGRVVKYLTGLNQGTAAFYETVARQADPTVMRVYVTKGTGPHAVSLLVATRSGAALGGPQLQAIANTLSPLTPVQTTVTVSNIAFTSVDVAITGTVKGGYTVPQVASAIAQNINDYLDWTVWGFGDAVQWDDLLAIASNTAGMDTVSVFTPSSNVSVDLMSLPRLTSLTFTDAASQQSTVVTGVTSDRLRLTYPSLY